MSYKLRGLASQLEAHTGEDTREHPNPGGRWSWARPVFSEPDYSPAAIPVTGWEPCEIEQGVRLFLGTGVSEQQVGVRLFGKNTLLREGQTEGGGWVEKHRQA